MALGVGTLVLALGVGMVLEGAGVGLGMLAAVGMVGGVFVDLNCC